LSYFVTFSKPEARRFLLGYQGLYPARDLSMPDGISDALRKLGSVQIDPLNICGRNHDLVLFARVDGYRLDDWQGVVHSGLPREFLEFYDKALCIIPSEDFPVHYQGLILSSSRRERRLGFLRENQEATDRILSEITERGPLSSKDIEGTERINWWWGKSRLIKAVLDVLFMEGRVLTHHREGNRKFYDLPERLLPGELLEPKGYRYCTGKRLLLRARASGLLDVGSPQASWDLGKKPEVRAILESLLEKGLLARVKVDGVKNELVAPAENLRGWDDHTVEPAVSLLAPLDNALWDRRFVKALFGFDYSWEVYLPPAKRKYGYYVLPVLYGDALVGRVEPVMDFRAGVLEIRGTWWEEGFKPDRRFRDSWREAVESLAGFLGAVKTKGRTP
jgi:uncharacterized protein YcaQ